MEVCEITSGYVRNNHLLPPKIEELGDIKCSKIAKKKKNRVHTTFKKVTCALKATGEGNFRKFG